MPPDLPTTCIIIVDGPCIGAAPFGCPSTLYSAEDEPLFHPEELAAPIRRWPVLAGYPTSSGKLPVSRLIRLQFPKHSVSSGTLNISSSILYTIENAFWLTSMPPPKPPLTCLIIILIMPRSWLATATLL
ncbi:hypothetical protein GGX14DRAFT_391920 [Mycena pura]|uniref:Uncharacterized protein n=1 Tax=Mycena pura TaxID=153505 RepID=A0AAD6VP90_9AGAR|nr:hypothetical protein GGX14DRAFT_402307 [Mycena pura]KAJ7215491.1 hypothetical protein GGX14DRAFT_391920 [Mycena pura]